MGTTNYIEVDLNNDQKKAILHYASFLVMDEITKNDLSNVRKKWIRFNSPELSELIGELSYHFNRCKKRELFDFLDELICHLESYQSPFR
jgi:hypothetical protein